MSKTAKNTSASKPAKKRSECPWKNHCPYLGGEPAENVLQERQALRERVDQLLGEINWAADVISKLKAEKEYLLEKLKDAHQSVFGKKHKDSETEEESEAKAKRPGAPEGHRGATRQKPQKIDEHIHVYPEKCPLCGCTDLTPCHEKEENLEKHIQEDLEIRVKTTCYHHHHIYCPRCKKAVSVKGQGELPRAYIGPVAKALAGYLLYQAKVPKCGVERLFTGFFGMNFDASSIVGLDTKLYKKGLPLYEQIKQQIRLAPFDHADETGWNEDGSPRWLWYFGNPSAALYHIDEKRSSEVVKEILGEEYNGILISDDYSAYNPVKARNKQKCAVHFLRNIKDVLEKEDLDTESREFLEKSKELIKQAVEAHKDYRDGKETQEGLSKLKDEIFDKFTTMCSVELKNQAAENLRKRILRHGEELFTFLSHPEIDSENNRAERALRGNVILRKITFGHRSEQGTKNHSVAMSLLETAKLNGTSPRELLVSLLTRPCEETSRILFGSVAPRAP